MLSIHLRLGLPSGLFPSGFPTNNLYTFLFYPIRATCPVHLILLSTNIYVYCPSMERLSNSDPTVTQLWNPVESEDGGDMFSETSVLPRATRYKVPEGSYNRYHREIIPEETASVV
jgi:hypothetical protein